MLSSRVSRLPRWSSSVAVVTLLLGGCSDAPSQTDGPGSSTTTDTTGPGPIPVTSTGSTSTGVVDDTGTSGSSSSGGTTGESQSCCNAHAGAGCDDVELAKCVCEQEAFCCAFDWDDECVELAGQCGGCGAATGTTAETTGNPEPSPCCAASEQPGCAEDPMLEACVCDLDSFCCDEQWDAQCTQTAVRQCSAVCETSGEPCCAPTGTPGCPEDPAVEACVCNFDAYCCDRQWDAMCVGIGQGDCGLDCIGGGGGGGGDCCMAQGGPECDDMAVNDCVCELDGYCCDVQWDEICVSEAQYVCMDDCGLPPANMGDCCMEQPGPGCDDMAVTDCTCMIDFGCCLFSWDSHCAAIAVTACDIACEGIEPLDPCCLSQPDPGCSSDPAVEDCVCDIDSFCCDTQWDDQCAGLAQFACDLDCSGEGGMGGTSTGGSSSTG